MLITFKVYDVWWVILPLIYLLTNSFFIRSPNAPSAPLEVHSEEREHAQEWGSGEAVRTRWHFRWLWRLERCPEKCRVAGTHAHEQKHGERTQWVETKGYLLWESKCRNMVGKAWMPLSKDILAENLRVRAVLQEGWPDNIVSGEQAKSEETSRMALSIIQANPQTRSCVWWRDWG